MIANRIICNVKQKPAKEEWFKLFYLEMLLGLSLENKLQMDFLESCGCEIWKVILKGFQAEGLSFLLAQVGGAQRRQPWVKLNKKQDFVFALSALEYDVLSNPGLRRCAPSPWANKKLRPLAWNLYSQVSAWFFWITQSPDASSQLSPASIETF